MEIQDAEWKRLKDSGSPFPFHMVATKAYMKSKQQVKKPDEIYFAYGLIARFYSIVDSLSSFCSTYGVETSSSNDGSNFKSDVSHLIKHQDFGNEDESVFLAFCKFF